MCWGTLICQWVKHFPKLFGIFVRPFLSWYSIKKKFKCVHYPHLAIKWNILSENYFLTRDSCAHFFLNGTMGTFVAIKWPCYDIYRPWFSSGGCCNFLLFMSAHVFVSVKNPPKMVTVIAQPPQLLLSFPEWYFKDNGHFLIKCLILALDKDKVSD